MEHLHHQTQAVETSKTWKNKLKPILLVSMGVLSLTTFASNAQPAGMSGEDVHWGYQGHEGPEYWGSLAAEFSTCKSGQQQSPVNITPHLDENLPSLNLNYQVGGAEVVNNGHAIQVNYAPGSSIEIEGVKYELKQFHFHHPSENHIDGKSFPLEAHLVHQSADGRLAVVAVMFEDGAENTELAKIWQALPEMTGEHHKFSDKVDINKLLPKDKDYYQFSGSLTTPPCSEGVTWIVLKSYMTVTKDEISKFEKAIKEFNNRPVQRDI